jgi:hypothetical protein
MRSLSSQVSRPIVARQSSCHLAWPRGWGEKHSLLVLFFFAERAPQDASQKCGRLVDSSEPVNQPTMPEELAWGAADVGLPDVLYGH